jgi:hypothetical protein
LLSAFCDGEANADEAAALREHLRACAGCRSTVRAYRAAPRAAAALAPVLPASRSLLERLQETLAELGSRLPGANGGTDAAATQIAAAGGAQSAGLTALAKVVTLCLGAAGGAAACMATGVLPPPLDLAPDRSREPAIERSATAPATGWGSEAAPFEHAPEPPVQQPSQAPAAEPRPEKKAVEAAAEPSAAAGAVEYAPPPPVPVPAPAPAPSSEPSSSSSGTAAGEFGP